MNEAQPAKVLVAIKGLGIGGAERLIAESARHWDRQRFDYHVAYALPWKDNLVADLVRLDVPVYCIGTVGKSSVPSLRRLRRLVRSLGPAIIHAHLPVMGIATRLAAACPVVYTEHNLAYSYNPVTRFINRLSYGRNAAVIAVSDEVARSLAGYPGPSPVVIVNGVESEVDHAQAQAVRRQLGIGRETPLVVHVGNIRPGKGHETLIKAAALLEQDIEGIMVVSIGGEKRPGDQARLASFAIDRGARNFRLLGRREDALAFVAAADVFVNPSRVEGLPVAILEAMALGKPVVATAVGGVPDLIGHEQSGLLVDSGDPSQLAAAIGRLLGDRRLATALGARAQLEVERTYGLGPMVHKVEAVYDQVLSQEAAG